MEFGLCLCMWYRNSGDFHFQKFGIRNGGDPRSHSHFFMAFVKYNIIGTSFEVRYALVTFEQWVNVLSGDYTICQLGARRDGFVNFFYLF
jgi:hypothetical protein